MRDYDREFETRVEFIRNTLKDSGRTGIIFGNSGGKDSALVGILCKAACENTLALIMPCVSQRGYSQDANDARELSDQFHIAYRTIDLAPVYNAEVCQLKNAARLSKNALINIAPRLRMTTLYAVAASEDRLVAGTGNRSETYLGYFTKWGDGAYDFNPISDLTVSEIFEFLAYLRAPAKIITKAPSAGLFDGQTDEDELGISYQMVDRFLLNGEIDEESLKIVEKYHKASEHKRQPAKRYE